MAWAGGAACAGEAGVVDTRGGTAGAGKSGGMPMSSGSCCGGEEEDDGGTWVWGCEEGGAGLVTCAFAIPAA